MPYTLDQALGFELCFSALQTAAQDHISYALIDDYNKLLAVIANDLQFPYYIVGANQTSLDFDSVELNLLQGYGAVYINITKTLL